MREIDGNGFAGLDANVAEGINLPKVTRKFILNRVGASGISTKSIPERVGARSNPGPRRYPKPS